jgi:hypothetical protein
MKTSKATAGAPPSVSWADAMTHSAHKPAARAVPWSKAFHYVGTSAAVCAAALLGFGIRGERIVTRVETRVEQPKIYRSGLCRPMGDVIGGGVPITNDAAASALLNAHTLPLSEKERIAERAAWSRVESARINAANDVTIENIKSRDRNLDRYWKGSGGGKEAKRDGATKRDVRNAAQRAADYPAQDPDHGGAAFIDRFGD